VAEGGDVQLTAAHQAQNDDCQYLNHHAVFDVTGRRQSHKFTDLSHIRSVTQLRVTDLRVTDLGMHQKCHALHGKIMLNLHHFR
jgi:hypothetical protein